MIGIRVDSEHKPPPFATGVVKTRQDKRITVKESGIQHSY